MQTRAQINATINSLLSSGSGITAFKHRQVEVGMLDYIEQQNFGVFAVDNYPSVQAAIAAAEDNPNGGLVYLGARTYNQTSTIRISKPNVGIIGCGNASRLIGTSDYGHIIDAHPDVDPTIGGAFGFHKFKDFYIDSTVNRTYGCAIYTKWTHNCLVYDVNIGAQQFNGSGPVNMYDGLAFENQSAAVVSGGQCTNKHVGCVFSAKRTDSGVGDIGIGSNWYNGLITNNAGFWGDASYITGSRGVWLKGGSTVPTSNGGVQIETCSISFYEHGIYTSGTNRELFVCDSFPGDSCGGSGIRISGKLAMLLLHGGWAAGCGRGAQTPKHGVYVQDDVVGENYGTAAPLKVVITGGAYHSNGYLPNGTNMGGAGLYIGTGEVCLTGVSSFSNAGSQLVLGPNVTAASIVGGNISSMTNNSSITPKIRGVIGLADAA